MNVAVYVVLYLGFLIFVAGCIRRVLQYARMPLHLRWELYPVPHEEPARAAHGGSYFESVDWWKQKSHFNLQGELRAMVPEMLFLKALWEFNRKLWYASFLFHFGLYLTIATLVLVLGQGLLTLSVAGWAYGTGGLVLAGMYHITGYAGVALALIGAVALLARRVSDPQLKNYNVPADLFNLVFFIVTFGLLGAGYLTRPAGVTVTALARGVLTFDRSVPIGGIFGAGLLLASVLVAYIPYTHMAHFIAKYFTYHSVRWDDRANLRAGRIESTVAGYLDYKPTWAAPHMGATGERTWAEIATTNPAQEVHK